MLEEAGILFDVKVSDTDEDKIKKQISSLPFSEQVVDLAKAKAAVSYTHLTLPTRS